MVWGGRGPAAYPLTTEQVGAGCQSHGQGQTAQGTLNATCHTPAASASLPWHSGRFPAPQPADLRPITPPQPLEACLASQQGRGKCPHAHFLSRGRVPRFIAWVSLGTAPQASPLLAELSRCWPWTPAGPRGHRFLPGHVARPSLILVSTWASCLQAPVRPVPGSGSQSRKYKSIYWNKPAPQGAGLWLGAQQGTGTAN